MDCEEAQHQNNNYVCTTIKTTWPVPVLWVQQTLKVQVFDNKQCWEGQNWNLNFRHQRCFTLMPSWRCVVGPESSRFSCSVRWMPLDRKLVLVALSAFGFVLPTFSFTFWKSSWRFLFVIFNLASNSKTLQLQNQLTAQWQNETKQQNMHPSVRIWSCL